MKNVVYNGREAAEIGANYTVEIVFANGSHGPGFYRPSAPASDADLGSRVIHSTDGLWAIYNFKSELVGVAETEQAARDYVNAWAVTHARRKSGLSVH